MRFKIGELFCLVTKDSSSIPACYRKDNRFFRYHQEAARWSHVEQFCKLPANFSVFGMVCGYDEPETMTFAGSEFNEQIELFLFGFLTFNNDPWFIRLNEASPMLYRVIDQETLEDNMGRKALLFD
jgi:hypothetical protein